ncbi:MAG: fructose-specific PTS transporter subunit EIIC, partial [Candidatus Accumulibacter sp.]|nr:fructose-specific PTS transporter subunit EIIC [Accumulibacter sp.]
MHSTIWVIIEAGTGGVEALLAAETLRRAAAERGRAMAVEIHTPESVISPLQGPPAPGDVLLLVGQAGVGGDFARLPQRRVDIDSILHDAGGIVNSLETAIAAPALAPAPSLTAGGKKRIVAVTSCPTGIAHTFMAAEGLQQAADALGYDIRIETQGSVGAGTPLTPEEIAAADLVVIAADREVDRGRFAGKPLFSSRTKPFITDGRNMLRKAFAEAAAQQSTAGPAEAAAKNLPRTGPYKHLMTGVSFMLPFVVAGGLCIALAFAIGGIDAEGDLAQFLMKVGGSGGFALMVPILAGYIAFSIADRPGIAPGMIGGVICNSVGTGFLGGIAAGFIAGYAIICLNRLIKLPKNLAGLMPILILPLLGSVATCLVIYYVIGEPFAALNNFLSECLKSLGGANRVFLGLILGGMMAVDMGGPVNKAAYAFSVGMLGSDVFLPMAAVMAGGMTPPLAVAIATFLFKDK